MTGTSAEHITPSGPPPAHGARRRPASRRIAAGLAAATLALVAACADGADEPVGPPSATIAPPATPTSAAPTPTDGADADADTAAPPFPANTEVDSADPSADAALTVTDLRIGHHDGFDRVVLELDGTGTPGWRIGYVDSAVEDPSDRPVDLAGDSVLQVMLDGTAYPHDTGLTEFAIGEPVTAAGTTVVAEAVYQGTFEAQSQAFVGVTGEPAPFRVFLLDDPVRVVIDIQG